MRFIILLFFLYFSLSRDHILANKYMKDAAPAAATNSESKNANSKTNGDDQTRQFRVQKLDFIWSKAVRKLDSTDQNLLLQQLKKLDKQLLAAKYERDDGRADPSGILSKDLEKSLKNLLAKFHLTDVYESITHGAGGDKRRHDDSFATKDNNDGGSNSQQFKDHKLRRLWMDAVAAGEFDDAEMAALETEFRHHQNKLVEYENMRASDAKGGHREKENSVLFDDHYDRDHETKSAKANTELKQKFKEIQRDYDSLKRTVADKIQSKQQEASSTISHPRVVPLLEKARAMYSGEELASIEEELRHFETRLKKLEYLKAAEATAGHHHGKLENDDGPAKKKKKEKSTAPIVQYDRELSDHLSQYSRKVDKYEQYLSSKLEL